MKNIDYKILISDKPGRMKIKGDEETELLSPETELPWFTGLFAVVTSDVGTTFI